MDHAAIISIYPVRYTFDFNPGTHSLRDRDHVEASPEGSKPTLELTQSFDVGLDPRSIDFYSVLLRTSSKGLERIDLAAMT